MLIIPHVRESDNGEYCCVASNGIGEPAKSCGALQLKMSTSALFQVCGAEVHSISFFLFFIMSADFFKGMCRRYNLVVKPLYLDFLRAYLYIRTADQTPPYKRNPPGRIQSSVALCDPRQSQTRCHLA